MAIASTPTLLSLDRWADIMGVSPMFFNGAQVPSGTPFPLRNNCQDIWYQYAWQYADQVGREDLARAIATAEEDIANILGYWPAPKWIEQEPHRYPRHHRPDTYSANMLNVRGQHKALKAQWGKFIQGGQRVSDLVATATTGAGTLTYTDADGDGWEETVTVTAVTTLTDVCEMHVYFAGHDGDEEWEIRPARSESIAGGTYTATFWTWQFVDPDLWFALPDSDGIEAVDLSSPPTNCVLSAEVRRTYNDYSQMSARLYWEARPSDSWCGTTTPACAFTTQDGCTHVRNVGIGSIVPVPATYDSETEQWNESAMSVCRAPDQVEIWYYAGEQSNRYMSGQTCDPLPRYLAEAIAWLATARLERNYCQCGAITALSVSLREDLSLTGEVGRFVAEEVLSNPLGTLRGEYNAWQRIGKMKSSVNLGVAF